MNEKCGYYPKKTEGMWIKERSVIHLKKKIMRQLIYVLLTSAVLIGCQKQEKKQKILDTEVQIENSALSYIPNDIVEENAMQDIEIFQKDLLCTYYEYDEQQESDILHIRLISMETGELKNETELNVEETYAITIQTFEDKIVVNDAKDGKIHIFDKELKEIESYEAKGQFIYVDSSLKNEYSINEDEIKMLNIETGKTEILLKDAADVTIYSNTGNCLSVSYIDLSSRDKKECYIGLNLESGEVEKLEIDESFSNMDYFDGIWAGELIAENQTFFLGTKEKPEKFVTEMQYPSIKICPEKSQFIMTSTDEEGVQTKILYDREGKYISSCSSKETNGTFEEKQVWLEGANGYLFLAMDETGHDHLYFWNLEEKTEGENLVLKDYSQNNEMSGDVLEQKYYEKAKQLSERQGVEIKIAEQCATDYEDKTAEQEYDAEKVDAALEHLENAFSKYPDGFFQQLRHGAYRKIEINLVGKITNKEEIEGYDPNAFVQLRNGKIIMALNISENIDELEKTFYHESSHMIDAALEYDSIYRKDAQYSEEKWRKLNPESFVQLNPEAGGYYESYEMMPMEYYQEEFVSCFAQDYGKSFSTEDRATIFEEAMSENYLLFSKENAGTLHEKLEYYCECIRDYFDTTGWPECTTWEQNL